MTKYKQYFLQMTEQNQQLFADFKEIHDRYERDRQKYSEEFNLVGQKVVDIIRDWDRRLCSAMGRGKFSQYSQTLSEKFWAEVRKMFKFIDMVGVKIIKK